MEHLPALAERRLDEPPQLVLVLGVEAVVAGERLDDDDRRVDLGRRLERRRRHDGAMRTVAWYWTKTDR